MTERQWLAMALPIVLVPTMYGTFQGLHRLLGYPLGYLGAFVVYWVVFCLAVPVGLLGGLGPLLGLFRPLRPGAGLDRWTALLLGWPLPFPLLFMFLPRVGSVGPAVLVASLSLGLLIGVTEEVLWRGLYLRMFPDNRSLGLIYPSVLFALWHLAPLSVRHSRMPGGAASFVAYALLLGLSYGIAARRTGSIAWVAVAHVLHDSLGLGGLAYAAWLGRGR